MVMGTSVCMCVSMGACACVHCVNVCTGYVYMCVHVHVHVCMPCMDVSYVYVWYVHMCKYI